MTKFKSIDEYKNWVDSQDWYQTIPLSHGMKTNGKFATDLREPFFTKLNFEGKRVLDIGCNSGQYCFLAKRMGAIEVVGIDINKKRLEQARIINENEGFGIQFLEQGINEAPLLGRFDIVFCIAVLTEITDLIGSIEAIKKVLGHVAFIEMDIASPPGYAAILARLFRDRDFFKLYAKGRKSKHSWMISPSIGFLNQLFGHDFSIEDVGNSVRYRMIKVTRISKTDES